MKTGNWSYHRIGWTNDLAAIAWGYGMFAAVGDAGAILSSRDGNQWSRNPSPVTNALSGIAFGGGQFVTVTVGGLVLGSTNALDWTSCNPGTNAPFDGIGSLTKWARMKIIPRPHSWSSSAC